MEFLRDGALVASIPLLAAACAGGAALIAQIVWIRQLGLHHGSYLTSAVAVTSSFMAGLALGSWLAGTRAAGLAASAASRSCARLAFGFALYAVVSPWLIGSVGAVFNGVLFVVPAAMLSGAALPFLVAAASGTRATSVYAAQTLGAAAGPVLAAFVLLPGIGLRGTVWTAAGLSVVAGVLAGWMARTPLRPGIVPHPTGGAAGDPGVVAPAGSALTPGWRLPVAVVGGAFGLALQIVAYRLTALLVTGGTLRGYAMVLCLWLLAGAWSARRESKSDGGRPLTGPFAVLWGVGCLPFAWEFIPRLLRPLRESGAGLMLSTAEWVAVAALAGPSALATGAIFARLLAGSGRSGASSAGRLLAASTLGALGGGLAAGVVLIPVLGLETFVRAAGVLAACCAIAIALRTGRLRAATSFALVNAAAAVVFALPRPDGFALNRGEYNRLPQPGAASGTVLYERDGAPGRIAVTIEGAGILSCRVNGKPDGSSNFYDMLTQAGSAHLALVHHPRPRRVLVIGLGTGVTAGVAALHPGVERVDVVEIEPRQVEVARIFAAHNYGAADHPKVQLILGDARRVLRQSGETWDVILSEPSNLFVSGMVNLFTREFHALVRSRLSPGGVFLQWVHYYRLGWEGWRGAVGTVASSFPFTSVWLLPFGDSLVLASDTPPVIDLAAWDARLAHPALAENLARLQMTGALDLARLFLWGSRDTHDAVAGVRPCTDDDPWLEWSSAATHDDPARVEANRLRLVLHGPLEPAPLAAGTLSRRLALARAFIRTGTIERARAEWVQALALAPGNTGAREGLASIPGFRLTRERDLARFDPAR